jgi:hypothetical protein
MLEFLENIDTSFAVVSKGQCGCADYITRVYPDRDPALNNRLTVGRDQCGERDVILCLGPLVRLWRLALTAVSGRIQLLAARTLQHFRWCR